jgi:GNAT superfamily N-acetyltransferase
MNRLTWQHTKDQTIIFPNSIGSIQPQTLHGWLTLHWDKESIIQFLDGQRERCGNTTSTATEINQSSSFRNSIETTLHRCNAAAASNIMSGLSPASSRRLRLANTYDVDTIGRLVQGLADFENEPDAVNVTPDHYRKDGFQSDLPLFYCLLLEVTITATTNKQNLDDTHDWYACGMAFCWIGARQDVLPTGRAQSSSAILPQQQSFFLYLEDLFIEETYRGNGAGTFVMTTLGEIALSLKCNKMVWLALDWNTPALTFYQNKIGAHIVDGLLTTQFAGSTLRELNDL